MKISNRLLGATAEFIDNHVYRDVHAEFSGPQYSPYQYNIHVREKIIWNIFYPESFQYIR